MNKETRNDLRKRAFHRLVARALRHNPSLLDEAAGVVRGWGHGGVKSSAVSQWERLLSQPVDVVRREITKRTEAMTRLRIDSPFYLIPTRVVPDGLRPRIARMASSLASER